MSCNRPRTEAERARFRAATNAANAARLGWPNRALSEAHFVALGLALLDDAALRRARSVRIRAGDQLADVLAGRCVVHIEALPLCDHASRRRRRATGCSKLATPTPGPRAGQAIANTWSVISAACASSSSGCTIHSPTAPPPTHTLFFTERKPKQERPPAQQAERGRQTSEASEEIAAGWSKKQRDERIKELSDRFQPDEEPPF
jgi:hypothetical protein